MPLHNLTRFPRLEFIGAPTPLEYLPRFSDYLGREIFIKRDDVTPMAMGGNKLRKLEFLAADALREGADTLITAGAIQSNHVRQTAAVAAKLGLHCVRWVMWRVRWKSRDSVKGRLIFRRWWSHRAVPELTPDWLLGWNT